MSKYCHIHQWIHNDDRCYKCELDFLRSEIDRLVKQNQQLLDKISKLEREDERT